MITKEMYLEGKVKEANFELIKEMLCAYNLKLIDNPTENIYRLNECTMIHSKIEITDSEQELHEKIKELKSDIIYKYNEQHKPNKCINLASIRPGTGVPCFHGIYEENIQVRVVISQNPETKIYIINIDCGIISQ